MPNPLPPLPHPDLAALRGLLEKAGLLGKATAQASDGKDEVYTYLAPVEVEKPWNFVAYCVGDDEAQADLRAVAVAALLNALPALLAARERAIEEAAGVCEARADACRWPAHQVCLRTAAAAVRSLLASPAPRAGASPVPVAAEERAVPWDCIYDLLVGLAGASDTEQARLSFVSCHAREDGCAEYRFMGSLGFGAKFRSERWAVDYYPEDKSQGRDAIAARTNAALARLRAALAPREGKQASPPSRAEGEGP